MILSERHYIRRCNSIGSTITRAASSRPHAPDHRPRAKPWQPKRSSQLWRVKHFDSNLYKLLYSVQIVQNRTSVLCFLLGEAYQRGRAAARPAFPRCPTKCCAGGVGVGHPRACCLARDALGGSVLVPYGRQTGGLLACKEESMANLTGLSWRRIAPQVRQRLRERLHDVP